MTSRGHHRNFISLLEFLDNPKWSKVSKIFKEMNCRSVAFFTFRSHILSSKDWKKFVINLKKIIYNSFYCMCSFSTIFPMDSFLYILFFILLPNQFIFILFFCFFSLGKYLHGDGSGLFSNENNLGPWECTKKTMVLFENIWVMKFSEFSVSSG